ncbi:putative chitobiose transport system permease protein [Microbacterium sp. W4I4]|uniref:carbohydrate ABC transporter permease n=1 Tax=Microbacterium sp. W4I4 TaxID=3042295 RepID=UPI00278A50C3|nr:sugar ABC transporter permease [Microbacterium sp. W4I4]MDQ0615340.1 putative chitobiose transport system permease protein [Microbacterium sp. W4I4]
MTAPPLPPTTLRAKVRTKEAGSLHRSGVIGRAWYVPYLFLLPCLILFGVFFVWPAIQAGQLSLYKYNVVDPPEFIGFDNFGRALTNPAFWQVLGNSFIYMIGLLPFAIVFPLLLAILVNRQLRGIKFFRAVYFLPVITSMVAVSVAWNFLFADQGLLNAFLQWIGVPDAPIHFLLDSRWAPFSIILVEGWKGMGTYMMIFLAGLQAIPDSLYEAARVDGANAWQRLRHITVPMIRPFLAVALTMEMLAAMQVFTSVYMLTRGGPDGSTRSLGYYVWSEAFEGFRMGYASAVGILLCSILILLSVVNYRIGRMQENQGD